MGYRFEVGLHETGPPYGGNLPYTVHDYRLLRPVACRFDPARWRAIGNPLGTVPVTLGEVAADVSRQRP